MYSDARFTEAILAAPSHLASADNSVSTLPSITSSPGTRPQSAMPLTKPALGPVQQQSPLQRQGFEVVGRRPGAFLHPRLGYVDASSCTEDFD